MKRKMMLGVMTLVCALTAFQALAGGRALGADSFLVAKGNRLVDRRGREVLLRGVNLGGWLLQEAWMCPVDKPDKGWGEWDTREALLKRGFTEAAVQALFDAYQDHWVTESDLDFIAGLGMNCVRLPFWYRNFQDEEGVFYSAGNLDENPGFKRLDWLIGQCGARGIYVILDLHGAPGFQSEDHTTGRSGASQLFEDSEAGEAFRERTLALWRAIAARYRGNPAVAAYDLLNEPMNGFPPARKLDHVLWALYGRLYSGIREVDPEHLISMEGVWELYNLPNPRDRGWENVLYQTHNYNWKTAEIDRKIKDVLDRAHWEVPVYVGEFQSGGIWDYALRAYNSHHISWTTWTYKGTRSGLSDWFLFSKPGAAAIDPETASYEDILAAWSAVGTENGFIKYSALAAVLEQHAKAEPGNP